MLTMVIFSNSVTNPFELGDEPVHQADPRLCVHTILEHYKEFITDEELVALGDELSATEKSWQTDTSENLENYLSSVPNKHHQGYTIDEEGLAQR